MKQAKIIIGANFGDEGKGLATDYFSNICLEEKQKNLVICHNGGAQKGHTVITPSGLRHVFHHFGSGIFNNSDTYLSEEFILNPILFRKEYEDLKRKGYEPICYINANCRVTTPYDMLINQIIEASRKENKHGSCGVGIFETIFRCNIKDFLLTIRDFSYFHKDLIIHRLINIKENYVLDRLSQLKIENIDINTSKLLSNMNLIYNFIEDVKFMLSKCKIMNEKDIFDLYDSCIFEGSQGLLLDQNNTEYFPHLTPSNTGCKNPSYMIQHYNGDVDVEICYITRSYMTRHGAGNFKTECKKEDINNSIIDITNIPNDFQGIIRYGKIELDDFKNRIKLDYESFYNKAKKSLFITHLNETDNKLCTTIGNIDINDLNVDFIYKSNLMTRENIETIKY